MTELAGRVADAFASRVREHEEHALSPFAVRSYETRGRLREEELATARYYLRTAERRIRGHWAALWDNDDEATTEVARRLLG